MLADVCGEKELSRKNAGEPAPIRAVNINRLFALLLARATPSDQFEVEWQYFLVVDARFILQRTQLLPKYWSASQELCRVAEFLEPRKCSS